ncbi:MAG: pyridoxal-phosphate dependent enzyme, partial [SAR324 cluster bacterium]|nr:pyridoxal-phosphate dependent enzyme [SAR324 cluster bacterium]
QLGLIDKVPVIVGVQAEGSDAITRALETGQFDVKASKTIADSISVDVPSNGYLAVKNLKTYQGCCVTVSDDEILKAQHELSSTAGVFAEPASATAYAGFLKEKSNLDPKTVCVLLLTGNGLKDVKAASNIINIPKHPINSLDELNLNH